MNKQLASLMLLTLSVVAPASMAANDLDEIGNLVQKDFRKLSKILGAATSYKAVSPAEPLGVTGFDLALELTATELDKGLFEDASDGDWDLSYLPMPKIHLHKGLPFNLDVGAFYSGAPETDIKLWGAELRYSVLEGTVISPALALRLTYSRLEGVDELELDNKGIELSISKGFVMITPYAGIGRIRTESEAVDEPRLDDESVDATKLFAGFNLNLGINLGFEIDVIGDEPSYSVKTGFRF